MVGVGGQLLDYIIVDGLTLYQAETKMGLHLHYCNTHLNELSRWYERRTWLRSLRRHAAIAEAFVSNPDLTLAEIARNVGLSYTTVLTATSRYLKKPEQSLTLKSKV